MKGKIGLVPDESLLFDHLTGLEFTEFVGRMYGLARPVAHERARELLTLFELDGDLRKLIGDYSKGMRKRVAMAAALIHRPELFLLDEPFEGVDAVGARLMKEILLEQVRHGATVFLTSHVLEVVERLCDQVAIIHEGKLVLKGTMAELAQRIGDPGGRLRSGGGRGTARRKPGLVVASCGIRRGPSFGRNVARRGTTSRDPTRLGLIFSGLLMAFWYAGFAIPGVAGGNFSGQAG